MNVAYKHLDSKLRIADLTIGQWITVLIGLAVGFVWGLYLSPFGTTMTIVTAVYIGALPTGAAIVATMSEFDAWLLIRSAARWRRLNGRFVSGPGDNARGYVVREEQVAAENGRSSTPVEELDLASLWEGS